MKYSIGYKIANDGQKSVPELIAAYKCVDEVYFPWPQTPSGRAPLLEKHRQQFQDDMARLSQMDVSLNLLLNASCSGAEGFSQKAADDISDIIGQAVELCGISSLTAFSPLVARVAKREFPQLSVRASVNLRLASIEALEQSADIFDGYTIARELNHDLETLTEIRHWCDSNGKTMQLLANSGCMPHCPVQSFHDNLVAHEGHENADPTQRFADHIPGGCWDFYLSRPGKRYRFLAGTWIRPEDAIHYEGLADRLKLATRMHSNMEMVVRAYSRGLFSGNLAELTEPGHSRIFAPAVIDNRQMPGDWFRKITSIKDFVQLDEYIRDIWPDVLITPQF